MAEGVRHGRVCAAWRRVLYFVIPRVSRGIQQLRDSTVLLPFSGCCDYAQHDQGAPQRLGNRRVDISGNQWDTAGVPHKGWTCVDVVDALSGQYLDDYD